MSSTVSNCISVEALTCTQIEQASSLPFSYRQKEEKLSKVHTNSPMAIEECSNCEFPLYITTSESFKKFFFVDYHS